MVRRTKPRLDKCSLSLGLFGETCSLSDFHLSPTHHNIWLARHAARETRTMDAALDSVLALLQIRKGIYIYYSSSMSERSGMLIHSSGLSFIRA
jgi:hypothetical protein